jgi:hypothetical protein
MKPERVHLLCVVFLLAFGFRATGAEGDLKQFVLDAVRRNESLFKNFEVEFVLHWYDPEGKRLEPPGVDRFVTEERWHYAREGNKIYGEFGTDWSNGYSESGTQVYDGNLMRFYRQDLSSGLIQSRRKFPTSAVPDRFTNLYRNVGDLTMSEFLLASTIKKVTSCEGKGMRGFLVEVIHKDTSPDNPLEQKIYFDVDKGMVPVVVETYRLSLSSQQAVLVDEVLEFERVTEEIYFPRKARLLWYSPQKEADAGQPKKLLLEDEVRVDVSRIRVNADLPETMFRLDYPPGTSVYDETLDLSYRVGVAREHLSELDRMVKDEFQSGRGDANVVHAESPEVNETTSGRETGAKHARGNLLSVSTLSSRVYLLIMVLVAALAVTGGLVLRRQWKK